MKPERIPLFPLNVVLFPGAPLPLHIFEPRYKLMIGTCIEENLDFGVVLSDDNRIVSVGCTAKVLKLIKKFDDGRMDIITIGGERFRVSKLIDEKLYYEAAVEYLDDVKEPLPPDAHPLIAAFESCYLLAHGMPAESPIEPGAELSYRLAAEIPLDLKMKQELLEERSELARRELLLAFFKEWESHQTRILRARTIAGGNGHAYN